MKLNRVIGLFVVVIFLTGAGAAFSINIEILGFGGDDSGESNKTSTNKSSNSSEQNEDKGFSYGGKESDQITDDEVEKGLLEMIVSAVVNFLFG